MRHQDRIGMPAGALLVGQSRQGGDLTSVTGAQPDRGTGSCSL
jgi:hypothetical protein